MHWHILTGEYPPQRGGVSDYTQLVARALAVRGESVTVFAPACRGQVETSSQAGLSVHRLPDNYGRASLREIDRVLARSPHPRRILAQWVPHAFGWKALNVPFCWWLRSKSKESVWVMFHEVAFPVRSGQTLAQNALGLATRGMAALVGSAAERAFVSIPAWEPHVRSIVSSGVDVIWLPVPSVIDVAGEPAQSALIHDRIAPRTTLVGHFGTYGRLTRPLLVDVLKALECSRHCAVLLMGRGSDDMASEVLRSMPGWRGRLYGAGELPSDDLSRHIGACDVLVQPYPDGVSSRRSSLMAALAHGRAVVTTEGPLTESLWRESAAVVLTRTGDAGALAAEVARLAADPARARVLGAAARSLYDARFALGGIVDALMRADRGEGRLRAVS